MSGLDSDSRISDVDSDSRPAQSVLSSTAAIDSQAQRDYDQDREMERGDGISDEDYLAIFRDSHHQSVLPDLPHMPGYHVCWLTTSNPRDSIQWRRRIGYELITKDMMPTWNGESIRTADRGDVIGINEMVAARIPIARYNALMREVHERMPLEEEFKIKRQIDAMKVKARESGARLVEDSEEGEVGDIVQRASSVSSFEN